MLLVLGLQLELPRGSKNFTLRLRVGDFGLVVRPDIGDIGLHS